MFTPNKTTILDNMFKQETAEYLSQFPIDKEITITSSAAGSEYTEGGHVIYPIDVKLKSVVDLLHFKSFCTKNDHPKLHHYEKLFNSVTSTILTMDGTFDAIFCNDTLLFENKQNFEKALLYQEVKQAVAVETLDAIGEIGFVEDFDRVKEFLKDDYHSINKLNKIKEKPYFQTLTFAKCKKIIEDYNVEIDIDEDNNQFNITSKAQAKHFIKVLNDDYLLSELTALKYAANSKENA